MAASYTVTGYLLDKENIRGTILRVVSHPHLVVTSCEAFH